ncbi:MAG TPA: CBS domain-containing protein [Planctomycetota bacterium]
MEAPRSLRTRPLRQVMSPNPVVVDRAATLDQALSLLECYGIRHLPVAECNRLLGILSDRDLRLATGLYPAERRLADAQGRPLPGAERVADVMRQPVHSLPPEATVPAALECLLEHEIGSVPIVQDGCLVGLVTETDLLRLFLELRGALGTDAPARAAAEAPMPTVAGEASLPEGLGRIARHGQHLGVLADGRLAGIVSDRDLGVGIARATIQAARAESEGRCAPVPARVCDVMTTRLVTATPETPLWTCTARLLDHGIGALPLLADERPVGMLTVRHLLARLGTTLGLELTETRPALAASAQARAERSSAQPVRGRGP